MAEVSSFGKQIARATEVRSIGAWALESASTCCMERKRCWQQPATALVRAGLWQLPNVHIHTTDCVHLQGIIIARGFMKRVPAQFPLEAHAFMSSRRLGQPMLVMILEARVDCADVQPARCGFKETDFKWVSTSEYEAQCGEMSEVRLSRPLAHARVLHYSCHRVC